MAEALLREALEPHGVKVSSAGLAALVDRPADEHARALMQERDIDVSAHRARQLTPELLALWVKEPDARKMYVEAFKRSSMEGMLNYYQANYPREPYKDDKDFPKVKCPVLLIHGLDDPYLLPGALNDTWKWLEKDLTLVTVPKAGHFVHRDATETVSRVMVRWLRAD